MTRAFAVGATVGAGLGAAYWRLRHVAPFRPTLERLTVPLPAGAAGLDGLRIGFVTDTHIGPFTTPADLQRGLRLLDHEAVDLVLLGGDYVSESAVYAPIMAQMLGDYVDRVPLGGIGVLGNHDLGLGPTVVRSELERAGIRVLRNASEIVRWNGADLAIVGIDDTIIGRPDLDRAFAGLPVDLPKLALWHEADFAEDAARYGAFVQLSGHTHGGQVRLPGFGAIWLPPDGKRRDLGWFDVESMPVYVSRGLGVYRPPVRFRCPPEVTSITLRWIPENRRDERM